MLIPFVLFILGLVLLVKGGDLFVDGASSIAHRFRIPELLIGATVVSIGTTLPEVTVSLTSALSGHGEIAYGNAIGSVLCNMALIAALTAAVRPTEVDRSAIRLPAAAFFAAVLCYSLTAYAVGFFSRLTGIVLLAMFALYLVLSVWQSVRGEKKRAAEEERASAPEETPSSHPLFKDILFLIVGAALIAVGADLLVDNGTEIARLLGVPEAVIALTFIALGTSLPELATAVTALVKGHSALSLGNVIGASLFNLVLVSGLTAAVSPFAIPSEKTIGGINSSLVLDIPVMAGVSLLLILPALLRGRLFRLQGIVLLAVYAAFCLAQFLI
ncbi:MAG: calcium/sodium antiporter [Ruminococcaceae bacterium]|nr:calcium/sodium antiporter [Oscillospiraceae bacterium]